MDRIIDALLTLSGGHYNHEISEMAVGLIEPAVLYCENGDKWDGSFKDYLEKMDVDYHTARDLIEQIGKLPEHVTCGDAYYALAMMHGDYGLAIHGDKKIALKLAYGYLTDPDR